jgi:protein ImuB
MFAAVYAAEGSDVGVLVDVGRAFSPRVEEHLPREVVLDVDGLTRLFGDARTIAAEIRRTAADRKLRVRVAIAGSRVAARLLVRHRAGLTVIDPADGPAGQADAEAVAQVPIELLLEVMPPPDGTTADAGRVREDQERVRTLRRWGLRTMGELAALPPDDVAARLGAAGAHWWHVARGEDHEPLVPTVADERFEQSLDLEWPIEGLEPLSFVLGRLIEPLSAHLERRDRGVAVLHLRLRLVNKTVHEQSLQLPTPMRDPKALRMIALLALESNPPAAGIDRVTVTADPTPARVLQHSLLTRPVPMPEEIATLMARLNALMGEGRCGAPAVVDSWRPGASAVAPFAPDTTTRAATPVISTPAGQCLIARPPGGGTTASPAMALRRFRFPIPARVTVEQGKPVRVATDRRGMTGGRVEMSAGPWRTSGQWWEDGKTSQAPSALVPWDRDEWDVTLSDGATYRVFTERGTRAWFVDGLFD